MGKLFLSILIASILVSGTVAQLKMEMTLDTIVKADEVYLDPLNQIYLINNADKSISKLNIDFQLKKKISFNKGWDHAVMDVSDPFKCILYYPGDYKILILDESLSVIASFDESELNTQSAVCHYTTDYIGIFSNNVLKLKNYEQQKSISSDLLYHTEKSHTQFPYKLKQSNEYLYLLKPGYGICRYTNQLFEDNCWTKSGIIEKLDVTGDRLFYFNEEDLMTLDIKLKKEEVILKGVNQLKSFAVNSEFIVVLLGDHLQLFKWK